MRQSQSECFKLQLTALSMHFILQFDQFDANFVTQAKRAVILSI